MCARCPGCWQSGTYIQNLERMWDIYMPLGLRYLPRYVPSTYVDAGGAFQNAAIVHHNVQPTINVPRYAIRPP